MRRPVATRKVASVSLKLYRMEQPVTTVINAPLETVAVPAFARPDPPLIVMTATSAPATAASQLKVAPIHSIRKNATMVRRVQRTTNAKAVYARESWMMTSRVAINTLLTA